MAEDPISDRLWPVTGATVALVPGTEKLPKGGEEWVVFGGAGQQYATNAAREFYDAQGKKNVVAAFNYPSRAFDIDNVATALSAYVDKRRMSKLNIIGA
ncbi:MAG TPA: hypothetical protein VF598_10775, partial [Hymenobacter sp.]